MIVQELCHRLRSASAVNLNNRRGASKKILAVRGKRRLAAGQTAPCGRISTGSYGHRPKYTPSFILACPGALAPAYRKASARYASFSCWAEAGYATILLIRSIDRELTGPRSQRLGIQHRILARTARNMQIIIFSDSLISASE